MNILLFSLFTIVSSEWELPFEFNVDFLKLIGGYSPLISSTYIPSISDPSQFFQPILQRNVELGSNNSSCLWDCFDFSSFPTPIDISIDPVNATSICPPYTVGEPIQPEIHLPTLTADGSCSEYFPQPILSHTNSSITCSYHIDPTASCTSIDELLLSFWMKLSLPEALCNCDQCNVPMIVIDSDYNDTSPVCRLTTVADISITQRDGIIVSFVTKPSSNVFTLPLDRIPLEVNVRFYEYHEPSNDARFWSSRGHFWCPSEISCWSELWFPLSNIDPLSSNSIVVCIVISLIITVIFTWVTIPYTYNYSNRFESHECKKLKTPY